jgi:hypothetical protein
MAALRYVAAGITGSASGSNGKGKLSFYFEVLRGVVIPVASGVVIGAFSLAITIFYPVVEVQVAHDRFHARARAVTGRERDQIWQKMIEE